MDFKLFPKLRAWVSHQFSFCHPERKIDGFGLKWQRYKRRIWNALKTSLFKDLPREMC